MLSIINGYLFVLVFKRALSKFPHELQFSEHKNEEPDFGHGRRSFASGRLEGEETWLEGSLFAPLLWAPGPTLSSIINLTLPVTFQNLCRNSIVKIILKFVEFG